MVAIYVRLIKANKITLNEVPLRWREQVEIQLNNRP